jgi:ComEC/Rec2-related protein
MVWIYSVSLTAGVFGWTVVAAVYPALLAVALLAARGDRRRILLAGALSAACFCCGLLSSESFQRDFERVRVRSAAAAGGQVELTGRVCGFPEHRLGGVRFPIATTVGGNPVQLLASGVTFGVGYGDSLDLAGKLSAGRQDRRHYLMSRSACGYLRVAAGRSSLLEANAARMSPRRWAWRLRESIRCRLARRLGAVSRLPLALSIAERGGMGNRLRAVFAQLGISHLIALSGMHLGMIAVFVLALLRPVAALGRISLLIVLTVYLCVVGEAVSLYRAYAMALVMMLSAKIERPTQPLNALGMALFVLLLSRPGLAHSVAFQLSFSATLAVLLCVTRFRLSFGAGRPARIAAAAASTLLVSACVQLFLIPIQLHYFHGVSVLTPVTTLVFLPAIAAIMLLTGAALAIDWIAAPMSPAIFATLGAVSGGFERTLFAVAAWAPNLVELPTPNLAVYYLGQAVFWAGTGMPGAKKSARSGTVMPRPWRVVAAVAICLISFTRFVT